MANPYDQFDEAPGPQVLAPGNPLRPVKDRQDVAKGGLDITGKQTDVRVNQATEAAQIRKANAEAEIAEGKRGDTNLDNAMKLRSAFDGMPPVKEYRVGIAQLATGLKTAPNATGDNALIYAYAKTMDPASVVRESEMGMAASGQSVIDSAVAQYKKQFNLAGGGQLDQKVRDRLRREMLNKTTELNRSYNAQRVRFIQDAQAFNLDPSRVVGDHDGDMFRPELKRFTEAQGDDLAGSLELAAGEPLPELVGGSVGKPVQQPPGGGYSQSPIGQGMSGVNEGIANTIGAPVDLITGAINLVPRGINALANTNLPTINDPVMGSDWLKGKMTDIGSIREAPSTRGLQSLRRVGQSVGGAVVPAGFAGNAARAGGVLLSGLGGGIGGATAQRVAPGNPLAEMAGELAGGGLTAGSLSSLVKRRGQSQIEAAVPTSNDLRDQAGQLYRQAENRGIVADGQDTATLANNLRTTMMEEGLVSPTGRLNEAYPKARQALMLADDYAGGDMNPTQMQTLRSLASDGLSSTDAAERRLGGLITRQVDDWAAPMAPELSEARGVARRYLEAGELETARELAGARAGQFTGSGFENALRTDYRALDRGQIKGQKHFSPPVAEAIETVSRGTPMSNAARGLGRLYPSGPMSFGMGSGIPAIGAGLATGNPVTGAIVGAGAAGLGGLGRGVATHLGIRAADRAELIARNGGRLPEAQGLDPDMFRLLLASEAVKYLPKEEDDGPVGRKGDKAPDPLTRRKGQRIFPNLPPRR